jgi:hypothetical protein
MERRNPLKWRSQATFRLTWKMLPSRIRFDTNDPTPWPPEAQRAQHESLD